MTQEILRLFVEWTKLKIKIHFRQETIYFKEREIWWASLGMNIGYEENGKHETFERPVLVVKKFNAEVLWILPFTSKDKKGKYYFPIVHQNNHSNIVLSQLKLVSSRRLLRRIRTMPREEFEEIRQRLKNFF